MDINKILHVATFAGQIILESGGETYRVEETIWRICKAFGVEHADSFVTPTGIMATVSDEDHKTTSLVKRIHKRTVNLEKISRVNDLSRNIQTQTLSVDQFYDELLKIENGKRYSTLITLFFSALGAAAFSILFGGNIKDAIAAFIIGVVIKLFSNLCNEFNINDFFINSISGAIVAGMALVSVKLGIASNTDIVIIGAVMLLVPGLAITNAIRDTIAGDLVSGLTRAAEAFLIAISIAVGTGAILILWLKNFGGI
jgi:uncharacterized membrane protein YjjP (DUF1212 family)